MAFSSSPLAHAVAASSDTLAVTTAAIDTTGADLLIVAVANYASAQAADVSDSKGNTWHPMTAQVNSVDRVRMYYAYSPTVGTGHTFTASRVDANYPAIAVMAFSGAQLTDPLLSQNGATAAAATSIQPGAVSGFDQRLVVTALAFESGDTVSVGSGFTISDQTPWVTGVNFGVALAYKILTIDENPNPTWSWTTSDDVAAASGTFDPEVVTPESDPRSDGRLIFRNANAG